MKLPKQFIRQEKKSDNAAFVLTDIIGIYIELHFKPSAEISGVFEADCKRNFLNIVRSCIEQVTGPLQPPAFYIILDIVVGKRFKKLSYIIFREEGNFCQPFVG